MIKLGPRSPRPEYFDSKAVRKRQGTIRQIIDDGGNTKSEDFKSLWLTLEVRNPLWETQHGKCAFCELKRELKRESDVEHYRPKTKVANLIHPGYWWLAYEWENFLYACKPCNQGHKKEHFPIKDEAQRASEPDDDLALESPLILNPFKDNHEEYFAYDWSDREPIYVKMLPLDDEGKGQKTIELLGLNRPFLMEERAENTSLLMNLTRSIFIAIHNNNNNEMNDFRNQIGKLTSPSKTFCGFNRYFSERWGLANTSMNSRYGYELILDLHGCDTAKFNRLNLDAYFKQLCDLIEMEKCEVHFWDDVGVPEEEVQTSSHTKGTSAVCFILTSTIVVHTLDLMESVYVNIFSCKEFDLAAAERFTGEWFKGKIVNSTFVERL